ncbi:MAG: sulfite exporter TauE/SafE family protein [Phycisphaerales bacterium]|nr:MAG: sulfite exporter TauE/SafE family protein [Phycisphaerales bacterium]
MPANEMAYDTVRDWVPAAGSGVTMSELATLCTLAALVGLLHTAFGPDHYVPFIAMARAGRWSLRKTVFITIICGLGHVGSSVLVGGLGITFGWALGGLEAFESGRGGLAAWFLLAFGLAYLVWGLHRAIRSKSHGHIHVGSHGSDHFHSHKHEGEHDHQNRGEGRHQTITPWILFTIFVFGPCEPLIPFLMYPALEHSAGGVALVAAVFSICTVATMLAIVLVGYAGLNVVRTKGLERYSHALAGLIIVLAALAIQLQLEGPPSWLDPLAEEPAAAVE